MKKVTCAFNAPVEFDTGKCEVCPIVGYDSVAHKLKCPLGWDSENCKAIVNNEAEVPLNTGRHYLDKLGVKDRPDLWNPNDERQIKWAEQRKEYGFDERETWNLAYTWHLWIYERLKWYKDYVPVDLHFNTFIYKDNTYDQEQMIDMMLERLELRFSDEYRDTNEEQYKKVREIEEIWAVLCPAMWS